MTNRTTKTEQGSQFLQGNDLNEQTIRQVTQLQTLFGNRKVREFIESGVIAVNKENESPIRASKREEAKREQEQSRVQEDRDALMPEIMQEVKRKSAKAEALHKTSEGAPVYVNVNLDLRYVEIPGEESLTLYHYTELKGVDFSLDDINKKRGSKEITRGKIVPVTFSFLYEVKEELKKAGEKEAPEQEDAGEVEQNSEQAPEGPGKEEELAAGNEGGPEDSI